MRQMMGFFQVSEHRQDREIPWSQSQIADYGEWWCSDLQDLAAKPTLWWSILCFVPGSIRDVLHTSGDPRDGRRNSVEQLSLPRNHWCAKHEALLRALWQGATVTGRWDPTDQLQINYRSTNYRSTTVTTDLAATMSPLAFHLAVFHVRRRRNWPLFSIDWAWPISFPSSSPKRQVSTRCWLEM